MTAKSGRNCALCIVVLGLIIWASPALAVKPVTYDTRALTRTGDAAPGTGPGVVYLRFLTSPTINNTGQTAFIGLLGGPGVDTTNRTGIWSESGGSLNLVARAGNAAPGTGPGVVYSDFSFNGAVPINDAGQTAFLGGLTGLGVTSTNNEGIWSEGGGSLTLVARKGNAAPGTGAGAMYSGFGFPAPLFNGPVLNNAGQTAFLGGLVGPGVTSTNNEGVWSEGSGSLALIAREGNAAPGTGAGVVHSGFINNLLVALNDTGQTAFLGGLTGPGVNSTSNTNIWSEGGGSLVLVTREGNAAPGTGPGVVYSDFGFSTPVLNNAGQTAFFGHLTGPDVNTTNATNDTGIWSEGGGSLSLVARAGNAAPGTGPSVVYSDFNFSTSVMFNDAGQTAFLGRLTGPGVDATNRTGIWSEGGGSLGLVAREGDAAPGTGPGVVYSNFGFNTPVLNNAGQTAFLSLLAGPGVNVTNNLGIWATDPDGVLTLIAREGDLFDVNDDPLIDDLRTISSVNSLTRPGGQDSPGTSFNDIGQLAFRLGFIDGSEGIFVATIPEPTSLALLGIGSVFLLRRRRRSYR